ncbi:MAG: hypothetical protein HC836_45705 [Richelia sp. RM2_1_2]|nr:hypothetical protein [Richelia sp. RM2_1_2]
MADKFIIKNGLQVRDGSLEIGKATTTGYIFPSLDGSSGQALVTDGNGNITFQNVAGAPGGSTTQIQYNNAGVFAGDSGFTTDGSGNISINGSLGIDDISINGNTITGTGGSNGDIVLDPSGAGLVVATSGYDMSSGPDFAFATKGYVDSNAKFKYEYLRVNYLLTNLTSVPFTTSGINSTTISGGTFLDITFTGYTFPPVGIFTYGYQNGSDTYNLGAVTTGYTTRFIQAAGGAVIGGLTPSQSLRLSLTTSNTGAASGQHAWLFFTFMNL